MTFALLVFLAFADLDAARSEPDLNRRSELALMNADEKIDQARQAYQAGNEAAEEAAIQEVAESVTLSYDSLEKTHGAPRKSRFYKRAELKVSALMRRLSSGRRGMSGMFMACNRNKRSLAVDVKTAAGLEIVRKLIATAEVMVHNFRPGAAARIGLGEEARRRRMSV